MTPDEMYELIKRARYLLRTDRSVEGKYPSSLIREVVFFGIQISHYDNGEVEISNDTRLSMSFDHRSAKINSYYGQDSLYILKLFRREMILYDLANV